MSIAAIGSAHVMPVAIRVIMTTEVAEDATLSQSSTAVPKSFPIRTTGHRSFPALLQISSNFQRDEWWAHQGSNLGPAD